jgi:hypothetical protein
MLSLTSIILTLCSADPISIMNLDKFGEHNHGVAYKVYDNGMMATDGGWSVDIGERANEDNEDGLPTEPGKAEWT